MMKAYDRYTMLEAYLGADLHQDWTGEFKDPQDAFEALLVLLKPPDLHRMVDEFSAVLAMAEPELHDTLRELSMYLDVRDEYGCDERERLQSRRRRAAAELAGRPEA